MLNVRHMHELQRVLVIKQPDKPGRVDTVQMEKLNNSKLKELVLCLSN